VGVQLRPDRRGICSWQGASRIGGFGELVSTVPLGDPKVMKQHFDAKAKLMREAEEELSALLVELEEASGRSGSDEALTRKVGAVRVGVTGHPNTFHFTRLNSPDLLLLPVVLNSQHSMDGLNWPEHIRPVIWKIQLALIKRMAAREAMRSMFSSLAPEEQNARSADFDRSIS
jgi:hypothetical protein